MPIQKFSRNNKGGEDNVVDPQLLFGNLSQTNYYQLDFSSLGTFSPNKKLIKHLKDNFNVNLDFISRSSGLLCSEASLPGSTLATSEVKGNFMGISEEFAHSRVYAPFDCTFYVDNNYNNLRFFEGWIDYISSGNSQNIMDANYYRRMRYPDTYKCQSLSIIKFERNTDTKTIKYSFLNAFPKLLNAVPVSYGGADILKVGVSFVYDRYVVDRTETFSSGEQKNSQLRQGEGTKQEPLPFIYEQGRII